MENLNVVFPPEILKAADYITRDDKNTVISGSYQASAGITFLLSIFPYTALQFPYPVRLKSIGYFIGVNQLGLWRKPTLSFFELRINVPNNPILSVSDAEFSLNASVANNNNILQLSLPNEQSIILCDIPHRIVPSLDLSVTFNVFDNFVLNDSIRINWNMIFEKL